ncbi:hypothetical protein ABPG75_005734 [Micractinium tetrahymenae]
MSVAKRTTQSEAQGPSLLSLPQDILLRCLEPLSQEERFKSVSLVCKRLHAPCLATQLLRSLNVVIDLGDSNERIARAYALVAFLAAHARHVRTLQLRIIPAEHAGDARSQVEAAVAGCLAACGAASALEQLFVSEETPPGRGAIFLPALTRLQKLQFGGLDTALHLAPSISRLQRLEEASLSGSPIRLPSTLPASITRLCLSDGVSKHLPRQLSQLTGLQCLEMEAFYSAASMDALLPRLPSLCSLVLAGMLVLPTCLSSLTRLDALSAGPLGQESGALLLRALPRLAGLTCLALANPSWSTVPPAIAQLPRLQRLWLSVGAPPAGAPAMPQGPWLSSIRWLGLPWRHLEGGPEVLARAPRLEYLVSLDVPGCREERAALARWEAFFAFLARHPPLRCFGIESEPLNAHSTCSMRLLDAIIRLARCRPALRLRRKADTGVGCMWDEVSSAADIPEDPGF